MTCRRYQCQSTACGAVLVVGPRELASGRRYLGTAIALALLLWAFEEKRQGLVWAKLTGHDPRRLDLPDRWRTLTRWGSAALAGHLFPGASGEQARRVSRSMLVPLLQRLLGLGSAASRGEPNLIRVMEGAMQC